MYQRVDKKLSVNLSRVEIEAAVVIAVLNDAASRGERLDENYYMNNQSLQRQLVINSFNCLL
uniref:hypothetical protein n=1 Tax=Levilactobacillus yonginensis TaxID=1054041 RepID=UPI003F5838E1